MDLQKVLGFPLDQVRIDPDGSSTPPEVSPLSPPTKPGLEPDARRLLEPTHIEGLAPPPVPQIPAAAAAAAPATAAPATAATAPATATAPVAPPAVAPAPPLPPRSPLLLLAQVRGLLPSWGQSSHSPRWVLVALSSALIGFGATVLAAVLLGGDAPGAARPSAVPATQAKSTAAASPVRAPAPLEPCARQREAELVVRGVASSFALEARARQGGVDVLLGLSAGGGTALGLELNATTLAVHELLRDTGARELLGVVPAPSAPPGFIVDRASVGGFREWRTLPDRPEWALTRTNRALNLTERATQRSIALWSLGPEEELSRPKLEWQDAEHLALVLRRGGRQGKLVIGWLDPRSQEHSALRELPFVAGELGLPTLATQGNVAAVAAAARDSAAAPWHVELASSEWQGRTRRHELRAVEAGPDRESFAPSLAALPGARWFLQWTEGQRGLRRVRGATLDAEFALLGDPIVLSPAGASAGGGSVVSVDEGLLSLFLVQRGPGYELWATTLSCR
jgi:hypothetical protein